MALNHCLAMELKKPHRLYYGMSVNIGPTPCRLRQLITFFTRKSTRVVHFCHLKINHNVQISTKFTTDFNRKSFELKMIRDSKRNFTRRQRIQQWTKLMSTYSLHLWFTQHNAPQFMKCDKWKRKQLKIACVWHSTQQEAPNEWTSFIYKTRMLYKVQNVKLACMPTDRTMSVS